MIQPSLLSLVDREVEFCVPTKKSFFTLLILLLVGHDARKNPSSCDCTEIRTHVPTSEGFEVLPPEEPPGGAKGDHRNIKMKHKKLLISAAIIISIFLFCKRPAII